MDKTKNKYRQEKINFQSGNTVERVPPPCKPKKKMSFRAIASKRILVTQRCLCRQSSSFTGSKNSLEKIQTDLKSQLDQYINKLHKASDKFKQLTSEVNNSKEALQKASRVLNELTGYNHIETVKEKVTRQGKFFISFSLCSLTLYNQLRYLNQLVMRYR